MEQLLKMLNLINSKTELWDAVACSYKNALDALIRAGFRREEAIEIVARQGTGVKGS